MVSCNDPDGVPETYRRFVENRIREVYAFTGTPMRLDFQHRGETPEEGKKKPHRAPKKG